MTSRGTRYWSSGSIPLLAPDLLGDIIATAADVSLVISDLGEILSVFVNPSSGDFARVSHWQGRDMRSLLTPESVPKFEARLAEVATGDRSLKSVELNHQTEGGRSLPIRYTLHAIGPDGALLMLGRDLRPIADMQQQLVEAQLTLERDYETQREIATRMRVLMETSAEPLAFVSIASGRITELNGAAARLLGATTEDLSGALLSEEVLRDGEAPSIEALVQLARSDNAAPIPLTSRRTKKALRLTGTVFRAAGGRTMLCRFQRPHSEPTAGGETTQRLVQLYERGADAVLFTDRTGIILSANEALLSIVDLDGVAELKGRSLGDFLARGTVDLKVLIENAVRNGQMRHYATRMVTEFGVETPVEVSVTHLADSTHPSLGLVIRDASRAEMRGGPSSDERLMPTRDLVGAATLREIVAETTEVVEKMCIETAVELTGNNRVAAAEMLGLSRQSLYVKLRKYGLLARGD